MERSRKVIGYLRVSTAGQADDGVSLDAQREKIRAYAAALELDLIAIEEDAGASAKTLDRPGLQRALAALEDGRASGVLVSKLDRLTRSVADLGLLVSRYFARDYDLLSVSDSIDTRSAAGRLVLNVLASVGQWEREAIGERTADALAHLRRHGVRVGREGLGWRYSSDVDEAGRRVVVEVPEERAAIARMLELHRAGASLRRIRDTLQAEGFPTKRGGRWPLAVISRVLRAKVDPPSPA